MALIFRRVLGKTLTNQVFACDVLCHVQVFHPLANCPSACTGEPQSLGCNKTLILADIKLPASSLISLVIN